MRYSGVLALAVIGMPAAPAQTYTILYSFTGGADGANPNAGVIRDSAGNIYGTTAHGGATGNGAVFKLDIVGRETVLYSFKGPPDGSFPYAGVIQDSARNLYGTTEFGGSNGYGVVFKLDPAGKETVLYSLKGSPDGAYPVAGVIRDAAGNLFGTTSGGGVTTGGCSVFLSGGCGVVFKLDTTGKETVLHTFTGGADGASPYAGVIRGPAGNLYGTTSGGGITTCSAYGCGVVFKLDTTGAETVLHTFTGSPDGANVYAGVIHDPAHNLYGTAEFGGASGSGAVFKLDATGQETVLYSFTGGPDGLSPGARLLRSAAGKLYGTTYYGGVTGGPCTGPGCGVVFRLDTTGKETVLHSFTGPDGRNPAAGLIGDSDGNLYGTTSAGGASGSGVVFKLKP